MGLFEFIILYPENQLSCRLRASLTVAPFPTQFILRHLIVSKCLKILYYPKIKNSQSLTLRNPTQFPQTSFNHFKVNFLIVCLHKKTKRFSHIILFYI